LNNNRQISALSGHFCSVNNPVSGAILFHQCLIRRFLYNNINNRFTF